MTSLYSRPLQLQPTISYLLNLVDAMKSLLGFLLFLMTLSLLHAEEIKPNDPYSFLQWELHRNPRLYLLFPDGINAPGAWKIRTSAASIIVAIIDTGICYTHEDLAANMWHNDSPTCQDIYGCDAVHSIERTPYNISGDPCDDFDQKNKGHGTMCAGIIGAVANNGIGITGIAWNVQLMACKCFDQNGNATESDMISCIDYAIQHGAKILNCSWGCSADTYSFHALYESIQRAQTQGVILVAAAGNSRRNNDFYPEYPASFPLDNIIGVAATDANDNLLAESNYGPTTVHLGAPGSWIYSTSIVTTDLDHHPLYAHMSGTSMAAPHVTGALALLLAEYPHLSYQEIITKLLTSTDPVPGLQGKLIAGRLNIAKALRQE